MKKDKKRKAKQITLSILKAIAYSAEVLARSFVDQKGLRRRLKYGGLLESERLFEHLKRMNEVGYIKIKRKQNQISIKLTEKGQIKLLENSEGEKTDGKWRMLSFDIPEKLRVRRDNFRRSIKRIGFKQVQKSLWACPFIEADKIEKAITYYKVKKYVAYLIIEKSDIKNHLVKMFKNELNPKE
ncbi:hypothetical protein KJ713_03245 [Patescibacteria group bacterium]|nr:hypothetical protein [Patescibacteria group bacterium]